MTDLEDEHNGAETNLTLLRDKVSLTHVRLMDNHVNDKWLSSYRKDCATNYEMHWLCRYRLLY